jgi:hypothetical protein
MIWSLPADFHIATVHQKWGDHADEGFPDGEMTPECRQQNSAYIVHTANNYPALQAHAEALAGALEGLLGAVDTLARRDGWCDNGQRLAAVEALAAYREAKP